MIALANAEKQDYVTTTTALHQQMRAHHKESPAEILSAQEDTLDAPIVN